MLRMMRSGTFILILAFAACQNDEIVVYRVAKGTPSALSSAVPTPAGLENPAAPGSSVLWTRPADWIDLPASGMRRATFRTAGGSGAEVSVVSLAGPAGGPLSNVNRWRGQIGLPPIDNPTFQRDSETIMSSAGPVLLVDFAKEDSRVAAAILAHGDETWFFKMVGTNNNVGGAKSSFKDFLRSLKSGT